MSLKGRLQLPSHLRGMATGRRRNVGNGVAIGRGGVVIISTPYSHLREWSGAQTVPERDAS